MQCSSLPPDAWLSRGTSVEAYALKMGGSVFDYSVPVCHVTAGPDTDYSGWLLFPKEPLTVGDDGAQLELPADPLIATVAAASSAAEGVWASPTLTQQFL